jgi:two-component system response regulator VicR
MAEDKKVVVCIEDEPEMIDLVKLILGRKGFELVGAVGGREGLKKVRGFLFSTGLNLQSDLEAGSLSSDFQQEFQNNEVLLSSDVTITPNDDGSGWTISDNESARTYIVEKGLETLDIYAPDLKPDLVLLDLMMPDMDGWEVYQKMKTDEDLKEIPVIVVTAKAQSIDKVLGLHIAKVEDYVTKPFGPQELLQAVNKVLGLDES